MEIPSSIPPPSSTPRNEESESIMKDMEFTEGDKEDVTVSSPTSSSTHSPAAIAPNTIAIDHAVVSTPDVRKPPETAKEKLKHVWNHIVENCGRTSTTSATAKSKSRSKIDWPSYNDVFQDIRKSDYNEMLTCPLDIHSSRKRPKQICAQGMVCCAKLELFDFPPNDNVVIKGRPYSGLLKPGTSQHCLVRFSSALQPMNKNNSSASDDVSNNKKKQRNSNRMMSKMMFGAKLSDAKLFPAVAIKLFRNSQGLNTESSNVLFLGCKVGQASDDFFAHALCTQLTSRMPATLKPILRVFQKYSDYPLALGLSNLCMYDVDGTMCDDLNFPFCLTMKPCYSKWMNDCDNDNHHDASSNSGPAPPSSSSSSSSSTFLDDLESIPIGTALYDLYASPTPLSVADPTKLQRIGRIVSTSEMRYSPGGDGLWFRHQRKDEDYQLRPHWKDDLGTPVTLRDGTKGTASTLAGWELFEDQIKTGDYIDFEKPSKSPSLL